VVCDGRLAAEVAMNFLLEKGHKKIAYIGDCSYESRYVGYCETLIQNHIPMDYELIKQTDQTRETAIPAFQSLLEEKKNEEADFTAILCANDITAVSALEILAKEKKKVRDSISIISIDNVEEAQNTKPLLTTVNIPMDEMVHMAILLLRDRISLGHREIMKIEFPCRVVERESVHSL
ncbi:MAG: substrate-binding domain-containing protein, partial [Eubacterium sp.]|nr:substrate-binding domain-containing protein [Eubacterium sp.]